MVSLLHTASHFKTESPVDASERLLRGVAIATNALLTMPDYHVAIDTALTILGKVSQVDRIYIFEHHDHPETSQPALSQRWEWVAEGITPEIDNPVLQNLHYSDFIPRWYTALQANRPIVGLVKDFPALERELLEPQQILSILVVPIQMRDRVWGFVGFDQCRTTHQWSEIEITTLWAIAGSFGGAIARHQADQALQAMNQTLEEKVQQRTQALNEQNIYLNQLLHELKQANMQVIQSEKMSALGQMMAGIAHEINNPMNFIHSNLPYLSRSFDDLLTALAAYKQHFPHSPPELQAQLEELEIDFLKADLPKLVQSMRNGTSRIRTIIQSLRTFSHRNNIGLKPTDMHEVIDSTLVILQHRLKATPKREAIQVIQENGELPLIQGDAAALSQVFMNLLSNAIDALEEAHHDRQYNAVPMRQSGTIRIKTQLVDENRILIAIADDGLGIAAEIRDQLFNPFFTTKPVGRGTGLGLSISYQIVAEQHQGQLWCESTLGQGATFFVQLPIATTAMERD